MQQDRIVVTVTRRKGANSWSVSAQAIHGHTGKVVESFHRPVPAGENPGGVLQVEMVGQVMRGVVKSLEDLQAQLPF